MLSVTPQSTDVLVPREGLPTRPRPPGSCCVQARHGHARRLACPLDPDWQLVWTVGLKPTCVGSQPTTSFLRTRPPRWYLEKDSNLHRGVRSAACCPVAPSRQVVLAGAAGLEPACSRLTAERLTRSATRQRMIGVPGRHRTSNLPGKNRRLCRLSYQDTECGQGGWTRTSGCAAPNGAVYQLTYTLEGGPHGEIRTRTSGMARRRAIR